MSSRAVARVTRLSPAGDRDPGVGEALGKPLSGSSVRWEHQYQCFPGKSLSVGLKSFPGGSSRRRLVLAELHSEGVTAHPSVSPPVQDITASHGVSTGGCLANRDELMPTARSAPGMQEES